MARKRNKQRALAGILGKDLTRRSRGRCELCGSRQDVRLYELPPFPDEPDPDRTVMGCGRCRKWLQGDHIDTVGAWFLSSAVWSELPAVRLAAARMLLSCDDPEDPWLRDALAVTNVDPETLEFRSDQMSDPS